MAKAGKNGKNGGKKEVLVIASKAKDVVRGAGCQSSGDLVEALSGRMHDILSSAVARAKSNGRATVRPHDL